MRAIVSLAAKELCASWSGFALGLVAIVGFTVLGLRSRLLPDEMVLYGSGAFGGGVLAVLVSMGIVAPDRADGSIVLLRALPVHARWVMLVKLSVATVGMALVLAASGAVFLFMAGAREMPISQIVMLYIGCIVIASSLLAWLAAANARMGSEGAAGLVSLAVVLTLLVLTSFGDDMLPKQYVHLLRWLPWGPLTQRSVAWADLWPNLFVTALFWLVATWRFSRVERSRG